MATHKGAPGDQDHRHQPRSAPRVFCSGSAGDRCGAQRHRGEKPAGRRGHLKDSWVDIENGETAGKGNAHQCPTTTATVFKSGSHAASGGFWRTKVRSGVCTSSASCRAILSFPLSLYFKHGRVKMEVGLCKGKKLYDKRDADAQRSAKREIDRTIKEKNY